MSRRRNRAQKPQRKQAWRDIPEAILLLKSKKFTSLPSPASLNPDADVIFRAAAGSKIDRAIIESWRPVFDVTEVSR